MYLEDGDTMYKQSYIQTKHVYAIPLSELRSFTENTCQPFENRLSEKSYRALYEKLDLPWAPMPWISSGELSVPKFKYETIDTFDVNYINDGNRWNDNKTTIDDKSIESIDDELRYLFRQLRALGF